MRSTKKRKIKMILTTAGKALVPVMLLSGLLTNSLSEDSYPPPVGINPTVASLLGGGNFTNGNPYISKDLVYMKTLNVQWTRINLYPNYYYSKDKPVTSHLEKAMEQMYTHNVSPMLLFEYYGNYEKLGVKIGDYNKWYAIGKEFAQVYRPNGTWARSRSIQDWGITVFSAFNEPDVENSIPHDKYREALKGLADGVHSVDPKLKVIPGGFSAQNSFDDWTLRGYGSAVSDLINDGTLDGIDLHTYFDDKYAPLVGTHSNSAQHTFDQIKKQLNIKRDIHFYSTEFNVKNKASTPNTDEKLGKQFLTAIWDHLGVVKNDGHTPATQFAMPWSLLLTDEQDKQYGMRGAKEEEQAMSVRSKVLQLVTSLTTDTSFVSLDPKKKGEYILSGHSHKLWVWQNVRGWSSKWGTSYQITGIPQHATEICIYRWNGIWKTFPIEPNTKTITVNGLEKDETYMILAR